MSKCHTSYDPRREGWLSVVKETPEKLRGKSSYVRDEAVWVKPPQRGDNATSCLHSFS